MLKNKPHPQRSTDRMAFLAALDSIEESQSQLTAAQEKLAANLRQNGVILSKIATPRPGH